MQWTNLVNVTSPGNTINKSSGADGWNGGAISTQSIPAGSNGWVQSVAVDRTKHTIFGLSNGDGGQDYTDIDFAIHLQEEAGWPGDLVIFEGGAEKHRINSTQQNPAYVAGDVLKVAVTGGVVRYYKNEVLLYTSQSTPVFPLLLDASVFHLNAKVQDAWLCSSGGGSDSRPGAGGNGGNGGVGTAPTKEGTPTATPTRSTATSSSTATATTTATVASAKSTITSNPTSIYRGGTPGTPGTPQKPHNPQNPQRPNSPNVVNTLIYLHSDHLGSVSVATNASGGVVSQQEYDPWGKVRSGGVTQTKVNYTGQKLDDTGLLYYHARIYDPGLGRFVSSDSNIHGSPILMVAFPKQGDGSKGPSNPQALNRYSYVLNNPVWYVDPSGRTPTNPPTTGLSGPNKDVGYFKDMAHQAYVTLRNAVSSQEFAQMQKEGNGNFFERRDRFVRWRFNMEKGGAWDAGRAIRESYGSGDKVLYFNAGGKTEVAYGIFGNILFGYLGAGVGFDKGQLIAQGMAFDIYTWDPKGVSTADLDAIAFGYDLWDKYHGNINEEQLIKEIEEYIAKNRVHTRKSIELCMRRLTSIIPDVPSMQACGGE